MATPEQKADPAEYQQRLKSTGRNDPCPCGSGKKYKKCHGPEDQALRSAALKADEEAAKSRAAAKAEEAGESADDADSPRDRNKRIAQRHQPTKGTTGNASGTKPNNIPRRGAV